MFGNVIWPNKYGGYLQEPSRVQQTVYNAPLQQISPEFLVSRQTCNYDRYRRRASQRQNQHQNYRPTINPSKRHRDRLNQELENLSKLLPFQEEVIARLDKLSVLRLSVSYLRNKNFLKGASKRKGKQTTELLPPLALSNPKGSFSQLFNEAIDGFMIVLTLDGTIFYISESVKSHLGYSQSQYLHQSLYSYIHDDDRDELRSGLEKKKRQKIVEIIDDNTEEDEVDSELSSREIVLRMKSVLNSSSSDMYKPFKLTGYLRKLNFMLEEGPDQYALFAFCQPSRSSSTMLEIRMKSSLFCSKNRLDLSFLDMDARGKEFFGYSKKDLVGRSSYVMVHRADMQHLHCKHTEIKKLGRTTTATFRLLSKSNEWTWICGYARVIDKNNKNNKEDFVVTTNRLMSDEEGDAMLRVRDSEDTKCLNRLDLYRNELRDDAAMKWGFPVVPSFNFSSVDTGPMSTFHENVNAVIAGSVKEHDDKSDDLLRENPEELFDVSGELLKSAPENILDSPEGFSDDFPMSPTSLHDPTYAFSLGQESGNPATCASTRSESISTMSDISVEQQFLAQFQRQQSSSSSASPCRPEGNIDRSKGPKKSSLTHLAKSLNEMEVSPPNVVAPPTDTNPYLEMVFMQNIQQNNLSGTGRQISPPHNQARSITDLSFSSPHQRAFTNFDGFMPNGSYYSTPPNTTCNFKGPIPSFISTSFTSNGRTNNTNYVQNSIPLDSFQTDFVAPGAKPSNFHFSQYNMTQAPNVTITAPDPNLQDLRNAVAANTRAEVSPKYPFVSPLSPTLCWSNNQNEVNIDPVESLPLQGFNASINANDQQLYSMSRQLLNLQHQQQQQQLQQQQQQQQRQNSYQRSFYNNDPMHLRNAIQRGHNGLK